MTASKTVLRQDLWTDQLKNMQSARVELSKEDKTQEMLVVGMDGVQAYQEANRVKLELREATVVRIEVNRVIIFWIADSRIQNICR